MKQPIKIYLTPEALSKLKLKAGTGRGAVSNYIEKIALNDICFLDANVKAVLNLLQVSPKSALKK